MKTKAIQGKENRRMKRARLIRDGMSWRQACLQSGYSLATANRGPRGYILGSDNNLQRRPGIAKDFERAAEEATYKPEFVEKAITHRMMTSMIEGKPSNVTREAKVLGDMKKFDLFVHPDGGNTVNIFAHLADPEVWATIQSVPSHFCSWCDDYFKSASELQAHRILGGTSTRLSTASAWRSTYELSVGQHEIEIAQPDHKTLKTHLQIEPETKLTVTIWVEPKEIPHELGSLQARLRAGGMCFCAKIMLKPENPLKRCAMGVVFQSSEIRRHRSYLPSPGIA